MIAGPRRPDRTARAVPAGPGGHGHGAAPALRAADSQPEDQRGTVPRPGWRGGGQQLGTAVEQSLVVAGELMPGIVVGRADPCTQLLAEPVHQLVHQHGHEHGLTGLFGSDQRDHATGDLPEQGGQPPVTCRADPGRGADPAAWAGDRGVQGFRGEGRRQGYLPVDVLTQHLVRLRRAPSAPPANPSRAAEFDIPQAERLIAVRTVQVGARAPSHGTLISAAGGGNSRMGSASGSLCCGSTKQPSQPGF